MESGAEQRARSAQALRVSLWSELGGHSSLLLMELLWRWLCGGFLLAIAVYDGSRIWSGSQPALHATGIFSLTSDSLLEDPSRLSTVLTSVFDIIRPQVEHAAFGLAPFALFCWLVAFALGRTAVLARYDARLPRRPWLLAGTEGLRLGVLFGASYAWSLLIDGAGAISLRGAAPNVLLYGVLVLLATAGMWWLWSRVAGAAEFSVVLALAERLPFTVAFRRAWAMPRDRHQGWFAPVRRARGKARFWLALLGLILALLPSPFGTNWGQVGWGVASTLVFLGAAGAVRLAVLFASLDAVRGARPAAALPANLASGPSARL